MQLDRTQLPAFLAELPGEVLLTLVALVLLAVVLLVSILRSRRRRRHAQLEERFGGEYERTLVSSGSLRRAEAELQERMQERRNYEIRTLDPRERTTFRTRLRELEAGFLDTPDRSADAAMDLVVAIAHARGYPNGELERCLDAMSVDHPQFVADLRRELARAGTTSATERRRRVVLRARTLIERLLSDGQERDEPASWTELKSIIDERRFHPVFQPIFSLDDGRARSFEALTRFDVEPPRSPDMWFQQAAAVGLGTDLELAAIEAALDAARQLPDDVAVSLNTSPQTLGDARLERLITLHHDRQVVLEVTEHALVQDYDGMTESIDRLRQRGARLAVDDTGAGISSLRHIVRLNPDLIKLDRSLTQEVLTDPVRQALASSLIHFAQRINSELIVEGVETEQDLAAWQDLGAHGAQGNLLAAAQELPAPTTCEEIIPRPRVFDVTSSRSTAPPEPTAPPTSTVPQQAEAPSVAPPSSDHPAGSASGSPTPEPEQGPEPRPISLDTPQATDTQPVTRS